MRFVITKGAPYFAKAIYAEGGRIDYYFRSHAEALASRLDGGITETSQGRVWRVTMTRGPATATADHLADEEA